MKKLLLLIAIFSSLQSYCQRKGVFIEPVLGYGKYRTDSADARGTLGAKLGCNAGYMVNDHFGISSGLQFQTYGGKFVSNYYNSSPVVNYEWSDTAVVGTIHYSYKYLEVPVLLRYISSCDNRVGIFAEAGFNFGFLVSSSENGILNEINTITNNQWNTSSVYYRTASINTKVTGAASTVISTHLSVGLYIPLSRQCSFVVEGTYDYGLTNPGNGSTDVTSFSTGNGYPSIYYYYYGHNGNGARGPQTGSLNPLNQDYDKLSALSANLRLNIKIGSKPTEVITSTK